MDVLLGDFNSHIVLLVQLAGVFCHDTNAVNLLPSAFAQL